MKDTLRSWRVVAPVNKGKDASKLDTTALIAHWVLAALIRDTHHILQTDCGIRQTLTHKTKVVDIDILFHVYVVWGRRGRPGGAGVLVRLPPV